MIYRPRKMNRINFQKIEYSIDRANDLAGCREDRALADARKMFRLVKSFISLDLLSKGTRAEATGL